MSVPGRFGVAFAASFVGGRFTLEGLRRSSARVRWTRSNYRGREVDLLGGPAVAAGVLGGVAAARPRAALPVLAVLATTGAAGWYDDVRTGRDDERAVKGFGGHVRALVHGRLTAGGVKLLGVSLAGVAGGLTLGEGRSQAFTALRDGALVAGAANLVNLFDLRPGRAAKVSALGAASLGVPALLRHDEPAAALLGGVAGALVAVTPEDLRERTMLGDTGANVLGAALGLTAISALRPRARTALLAAVSALTLASERVSFSAVIARNPSLRRLDEWGRDRADGQ